MKQVEPYHNIVPPPQKPNHLSNNIKWLSGEGCGSWFLIEESLLKTFLVSRYSPEGKLECKGLFNQVSGNPMNFKEKYEFTYLSHCAEVNITQNSSNLKFKLIQKTL